jgi:hypothetical protein
MCQDGQDDTNQYISEPRDSGIYSLPITQEMSVYRPTHRCNLLNTSVELTGYEIEFRVQALLPPFFKLRSGSSEL